MKDIFSTQEVAKLLGLSSRTIITWIDRGEMQAYKTLGGHRRIQKTHLIEFLQKNNIPLPDSLSQRTILVVDDDEIIRENIKEVLQNRFPGIKIVIFESTIDALLYLQTGKNKIILLDIVMPHMDGLELCTRIKKNEKTRNASIIAISGHLSGTHESEIISAGADDFYSKSEPLDVLMNKVAHFLGGEYANQVRAMA